MLLSEDLARIAGALASASDVLRGFTAGAIAVDRKAGGDPVTAADRAVDEVLHRTLLRPGEGWLSEETVDDERRLSCSRVWVVDPLDGTREFVAGIPEWCVSIGLVVGGRAIAGGIHNPATGETVLGALGLGVTYNGAVTKASERTDLAGARILASRSEYKRGEWERMKGHGFDVVPMGSVAYKLGLVAAGRADGTWTLVPKNEWDVAAGIALVEAAGGASRLPSGEVPTLNRENPLLDGLIATGSRLLRPTTTFLAAR